MNDSTVSPSPGPEEATLETTQSDTPTRDENGFIPLEEAKLQWHPSEHPRHAAKKEEGEDGDTSKDKRWLKLRLRGFDDEEETDWWFAGTAVPLIAATLAPLANVLSLAALVTYWREDLDDGKGNKLPELAGRPYPDPHWCFDLNVVSLVAGFVGNIFLLFNFTGRIRYIIALPATIIIWYIASGILIGITAGMHIYDPPIGDLQVYSQGYWYAVIAAILYFVCNNLLFLNMLGYMLGHYPQRFNLDDHQRTLILQTMLFFVWLAGGAAMFSHIESTGPNASQKLQWGYVDGLYFCDVTILTVGFGDLYPVDDVGRGLVFPYAVGGIIMLGLVISSLHKFAAQIGEDNIVKKHISKERSRTFDRTITESSEYEREQAVMSAHTRRELKKHHISAPYNLHRGNRRQSIYAPAPVRRSSSIKNRNAIFKPLAERMHAHHFVHHHKSKLVMMREEKDRFDAMRKIQKQTASFKRYWALSMSIFSFSILWCIGAVVFWRVEQSQQSMTYFQALYFAYVSLLTIGYGDITPKSNAGRAFYLVWSLIAVPTMTILISDMQETVIEPFKHGTFKLADFTVLPKAGAWRDWLEEHPRILHWLEKRKENRERRKRMREGMPYGRPEDADADPTELETPGDRAVPSLAVLATEAEQDARSTQNLTYEKLARRLAVAIRNVSRDVHADNERHYTYEEWVELTRLIRFTSEPIDEARQEEETKGMVQWDWIGEDSPMMSSQSEPEFVLERLCESLTRYVRRNERDRKKAAGVFIGPTPEDRATAEEDSLRRLDTAATVPDDEGLAEPITRDWTQDMFTRPFKESSSSSSGSKGDTAADDVPPKADSPDVGPAEGISPTTQITHWKTAPS